MAYICWNKMHTCIFDIHVHIFAFLFKRQLKLCVTHIDIFCVLDRSFIDNLAISDHILNEKP